MYADYSTDQVKAFLEDLTNQQHTIGANAVTESFSDEMILAEMELSRFKKSAENGEEFKSRQELLMKLNRIHPADLM